MTRSGCRSSQNDTVTQSRYSGLGCGAQAVRQLRRIVDLGRGELPRGQTSRLRQVSTGEHRVGQVRAAQIGAAQQRSGEVGVEEEGLAEVGLKERGVAQVRRR